MYVYIYIYKLACFLAVKLNDISQIYTLTYTCVFVHVYVSCLSSPVFTGTEFITCLCVHLYTYIHTYIHTYIQRTHIQKYKCTFLVWAALLTSLFVHKIHIRNKIQTCCYACFFCIYITYIRTYIQKYKCTFLVWAESYCTYNTYLKQNTNLLLCVLLLL